MFVCRGLSYKNGVERVWTWRKIYIWIEPSRHNTSINRLWLIWIFTIPGIKAQLGLLEWMVRKWNVQEECFMIWYHRLTIDANEIYFFSGLPYYQVDISLYEHRWGDEKNATYLVQHCFRGAILKDWRIDIKTIERLPLRPIGFNIEWLCGIVALHMLTKAQMQIVVECMRSTISNWCEGVVSNLKRKIIGVKIAKLKSFGMVPLSSHFL